MVGKINIYIRRYIEICKYRYGLGIDGVYIIGFGLKGKVFWRRGL